MNCKYPKVNIDILVIKNNKILLGLLTKKWAINGKQVYGIPGRDIYFGEKIANSLERIIKEEIGCKIISNKFVTITENFEFGNHYIGLGFEVKIDREPKLLKPDDWEKWKWIEKDKLPKNMFSPAKSLIDCYLTKEKFPLTPHNLTSSHGLHIHASEERLSGVFEHLNSIKVYFKMLLTR